MGFYTLRVYVLCAASTGTRQDVNICCHDMGLAMRYRVVHVCMCLMRRSTHARSCTHTHIHITHTHIHITHTHTCTTRIGELLLSDGNCMQYCTAPVVSSRRSHGTRSCVQTQARHKVVHGA